MVNRFIIVKKILSTAWYDRFFLPLTRLTIIYLSDLIVLTKHTVKTTCHNIILLCVVFLFPSIAISQSPFTFEQFTLKNGLSENTVNAIVQTRDGYLWIGTANGLNRFDGKNFKTFYNYTHTLQVNYIRTLFEDSKGNLWVGTWGGGVCLFDRKTEQFSLLNNYLKLEKATSNNLVRCFAEDSQGLIWIGSLNGGLFSYDQREKILRRYLIGIDITAIYPMHNGELWIASNIRGLFKFNPKTGSVLSVLHDPKDPQSLAMNSVISILPFRDSLLIVGLHTGVDIVNKRTLKVAHFIPSAIGKNLIKPIILDRQKRLWLGSYGHDGVYLVERMGTKDQMITNIRATSSDEKGLTGNNIRCILEDYSGNIWFGTETGLCKLSATKMFERHEDFANKKHDQRSTTVTKIYQDRNKNLWIGYDGDGFIKIDATTGDTTIFCYTGVDPQKIAENNISDIYEDRFGTIWIATKGIGLKKLHRDYKTFTNYFHNPKDSTSLRSNLTARLLELDDGTFLVGTQFGADVMDRTKGTFIRINDYLSKKTNIEELDEFPFPFLQDHHGTIWMGPTRYHTKTNKVSRFAVNKNIPSSLTPEIETTVFEDSQGRIWIGTFGGGVSKYIDSNNTFKRYTTANGLPHDIVFSIEEDHYGNLWMGTINGLAKFNPATETFRTYTTDDGLRNNEFNWRTSLNTHDGKLYFGGRDGYISFKPEDMKNDTFVSNVVMTSFKVFGREIAISELADPGKEITLEFNQNFFSIEYAFLDYLPHKKNQFKYMLTGFDDTWHQSGDNTTATYTDVHPGTYDFIIQASNRDGVWGVPKKMAVITIVPAFWMTWWFKGLVIIAILSMVYSVYRYRMIKIYEMQNVRMKIAGDLHDEIGSNLSGIAIATQMKARDDKFSEKDKQELLDIGQTAIQTANAMRDIVWFINPQNDSTENLFLKMKETAKSLLRSTNIEFEFSGTPNFALSLEHRRNLFLIYKEAIHNVVKHSGATKVTISFSEENSQLHMIIRDNGKFIQQNIKRDGLGLTSMKNRALSCRGTLNIIPDEHGTSLFLTIPFS